MKIKLIVLAGLLLLPMTLGTAWGQCAREDVEQKAHIVAQKMEQLFNKNQDEYRRILLRFNNKAQLLDPNDLQGWCDLYDQILFEI